MIEEMFDFGAGLVPAHRHPNGGGWVADTARVDKSAYVGPKARVSGNARVTDSAWVGGNARVGGNAWVGDSAWVVGNAWVGDSARVGGNAWVGDNAWVGGNAWVSVWVGGSARVGGGACCTVTPVLIRGHECSVTITDAHMQIGCECRTLDEWRQRVTSEECPRLEAVWESILAIAEAHHEFVRSKNAEARTE